MRGDSTYILWIVALCIALIISILVAYASTQRADRENADRIKAAEESRRKDDELSELRKDHARALSAESRRRDVELSELRKNHTSALSAKDNEHAKLVALVKALAKIFDQRKIQFPWLASAIADYHAL